MAAHKHPGAKNNLAADGSLPRPDYVYSYEMEKFLLAVAHFAQDRVDALFGKARLTVLATLLPLQALNRRQKPRCFWLAI
jgi:hypothetical protein